VGRSRSFKAFIASITGIAFLTTSVIWAPDSFASAQAIRVSAPSVASEVALPYQPQLDPGIQFSIPQELGTLQYFKRGKGPMVVHLQTAHGHYQAQKQIQALLHHLDKQYGIKTLLVEGSAFKLEPEILNFFPADPKLTKKANDALTKAALVKGPELYLLDKLGVASGSVRAEAYGIENLETYRANGVAFVNVLTEKKKTKNFLTAMNEGIDRLAAAYLSEALRNHLRRLESFEKGQVSLEAWFSYLGKEALKRLKLDLAQPGAQLDWPMLVRFFKVRELSAKFDQAAFPGEREKFLKAIERWFSDRRPRTTDPSRSYGLKSSVFGQIKSLLHSDSMSQQLPVLETGLLFEDMVKALPRDFHYEAYPNVCYFVGRLLLQSELKAPELMQETERLSSKVADKLANTQAEKNLVALLKDYRSLQKLFALELTPSDHDAISRQQKDLRPSSVSQRFAAIQKNESVSRAKDIKFAHLPELDQLFDAAMKFYAGVKERDGLMEQMIEKRLQEAGADKVAVITGGFHSEPFKNYFSSKDYSYALISPRITGVDDKGHEAYVENMLRFGTRSAGQGPRLRGEPNVARGSWHVARESQEATLEAPFLSDLQVLNGAYGADPVTMRAEIRRIVSGVAGRSEVRMGAAGTEVSADVLSPDARREKEGALSVGVLSLPEGIIQKLRGEKLETMGQVADVINRNLKAGRGFGDVRFPLTADERIAVVNAMAQMVPSLVSFFAILESDDDANILDGLSSGPYWSVLDVKRLASAPSLFRKVVAKGSQRTAIIQSLLSRAEVRSQTSLERVGQAIGSMDLATLQVALDMVTDAKIGSIGEREIPALQKMEQLLGIHGWDNVQGVLKQAQAEPIIRERIHALSAQHADVRPEVRSLNSHDERNFFLVFWAFNAVVFGILLFAGSQGASSAILRALGLQSFGSWLSWPEFMSQASSSLLERLFHSLIFHPFKTPIYFSKVSVFSVPIAFVLTAAFYGVKKLVKQMTKQIHSEARRIKLLPEDEQALAECNSAFLEAIAKMKSDADGALDLFVQSLSDGFRNITFGPFLEISTIKTIQKSDFWVTPRFLEILGTIAQKLEDSTRLLDMLLDGPSETNPQFDAALKEEEEKKDFSGISGRLIRLFRDANQRELLRGNYRPQVLEAKSFLLRAKTEVESVINNLLSRSEVRGSGFSQIIAAVRDDLLSNGVPPLGVLQRIDRLRGLLEGSEDVVESWEIPIADRPTRRPERIPSGDKTSHSEIRKVKGKETISKTKGLRSEVRGSGFSQIIAAVRDDLLSNGVPPLGVLQRIDRLRGLLEGSEDVVESWEIPIADRHTDRPERIPSGDKTSHSEIRKVKGKETISKTKGLRSEARDLPSNEFKFTAFPAQTNKEVSVTIGIARTSGKIIGSFSIPASGETGQKTYAIKFLDYGKETSILHKATAQFTVTLDERGILREVWDIEAGFPQDISQSQINSVDKGLIEALPGELKAFLVSKIGRPWGAELFEVPTAVNGQADSAEVKPGLIPDAIRFEMMDDDSGSKIPKPDIQWSVNEQKSFGPEVLEALKYWMPILYTFRKADVAHAKELRELHWKQQGSFELPVVAHLLKEIALRSDKTKINKLTKSDLAEVMTVLQTAVRDGRTIQDLKRGRGTERYAQLELLANSPDLLKIVLKKLREIYTADVHKSKEQVSKPGVPVPRRSELRLLNLQGTITPEEITLIERFYFKLLPMRFRELIEAAGGRGAVLQALLEIPGVAESGFVVDIPETRVFDGLFTPGAPLTIPEKAGKGLAVAKTVAPMVKDFGGKVFLGQDVLDRLMKENPRALFYLLKTYAVFSEQKEPPALLTVGSRQVLFKKIEDALLNKDSGLTGFETIGRTALLQALRQGKVLEVIEPAQGTNEKQVLSELAVTAQGGIASLHLNADMLPDSLQGVHFAFGEKNIGARDLMVASVLAIVLKSAADLIRNVPDANVRAGLLRKFVAENLPGVNAQGQGNAFVITQITRLAQEFAARTYIATMA